MQKDNKCVEKLVACVQIVADADQKLNFAEIAKPYYFRTLVICFENLDKRTWIQQCARLLDPAIFLRIKTRGKVHFVKTLIEIIYEHCDPTRLKGIATGHETT